MSLSASLNRLSNARPVLFWVTVGLIVIALPGLVALGAAGVATYGIRNSTWTSRTDVSDSSRPDVRQVTTEDSSTNIRAEWREIQRADGTWIKDGPSVIRGRTGQELEEGSYREGERDGPWTFWNEDGSVDRDRSGNYEKNVRVGPLVDGDTTSRDG